jgi:DNA-binding protein YbaB
MDMMKMMKQAADLQKNMKKKQKALAKTKVQHEQDGVTVEISCDMKLQSVQLDEALVAAANGKKLEQAVEKAVQGALDKAQDVMNKEMGSLTQGMGLPGNMKLPF